MRSLQKFLEPTRKRKVINTGNSLEFGKSCEELSWNHCTSTPHRSETSGIAERAVCGVKEGTCAVLSQSGLGNVWWADSMQGYFYLRYIQDLLSDGKTPMKDDLENHSKAQLLRLVQWLNIILLLRRTSQGIFLGYVLIAGRIWKGHHGCRHWGAGHFGRVGSPCSQAQCKKKEGSTFICPMADGTAKLFWKRLWCPRIQSKAGTTCKEWRPQGNILKGNSAMSQPTDETKDDAEARNDFWYHHHVEPRVKLYSPREESFPIPLKCIDVTKTTHTNLDVLQECRIDDYWNVDVDRNLSDSWTGFTKFTSLTKKKTPKGYVWSGERIKKRFKQLPDLIKVRHAKCSSEKGEAGMGCWSGGWRVQRDHSERKKEIGSSNGSGCAL